MPVHPTYPGVYVQEIASGLHTISAVATSTAAFIGTFERGLANEAVEILSMSDFEREYGGLQRNSEATYAIQQFFLNGGTDAYVVRIGNGDVLVGEVMAPARVTLMDAGNTNAVFNVTAGRRIRGQSAVNPGGWGNYLRLVVELNDSSTASTFNLYVSEVSIDGDRTTVVKTETFINLTMQPNTPNNAIEVVNQGSRLVQLDRVGLPPLTAAPWPLPAPNGTISAPLAALPASVPAVSVIVTAGSPATRVGRAKLNFPASLPVGMSWSQWTQILQSAIRNAQHDASDAAPNPVLPTGLRPYLTGATVDLIGDGTAGNPRRFVIQAGTGARPYDPAAQLTFFGGGLDTASSVTGTGANVLPDAPAKVIGTKDLVATPPSGSTFSVNGNSVTVLATDLGAGTVSKINTAASPAVTASLDPTTHFLVLTSQTPETSIVLAGAGLSDVGLTAGTTAPTNLSTQFPANVNTTLIVTVGGTALPAITFGSPAPKVDMLSGPNGLIAKLAALAGVFASVDAKGNISIVASDPTKAVVVGGTATLTVFGIQAAPTTFAAVGPQQFALAGGYDGAVVDAAQNYIVPTASFIGSAVAKTGLYALEDVDLFNILCLPDAPRLGSANAQALYAVAEAYVESRRAMVIVDIPDSVAQIDQMQTWIADNDSLRDANAAVYFPRTCIPDPLNQNRPRSIAASGTIAGLWARTDTNRGVWKAPAGTEAQLRNVNSLAYVMTDLENGTLNPLGINCLRSFPVYSNICWGARTLDGADLLASDWKYVPVRRTTLFLEESLFRGTKWVVFEPNDEPLWAQIRLNVGAFMQDMFRKGAFQGSMPRDAYFVKCDGETTTQQDIDNGIVNIQVGFAPLKPAEFVILSIQQIVRNTGA